MAGPLAAPIIGAVGSLLGGLFGSSKPKYVVPNYAGIRAAAEKAGFNPLTALQAAPGSVVAGENAWGSAIAQSASFLASGVEASRQATTERLQQQNNDLRKQIERATLRPSVGGIYSNPAAAPSVGSGVYRGSGNRVVRPSAAASSSEAAAVAGGIPLPDPFLDRGAGIYVNGRLIDATPGYSPAQVWENEYGEIGAAVYGLGKLAVDGLGEFRQYQSEQPSRGRDYRGPSSSGKLDDDSGYSLPRSTAYGRGETAYPDTVTHFSNGSFRIVPVRRPPVSAMPGYIPRFDPFHRDGYYSGPRL